MNNDIKNAYRYSMQHPVRGCRDLNVSNNIQKDYYDDRSEKYEPSMPEFNGWGSKFSQVLRFDVIIEEIRKNELYQYREVPMIPNLSILDFGCGSGDFQKYMPNNWNYLGVDIRKDVKGKNLLGGIDIFDDIFKKLLTDSGFKPHYCIASGSLAFMEVPQVERTIEKLLDISKCGVVFNLLDGKSDYMGDEDVVHVQRKRFFSYVFNEYRIGRGYEVRMRTDYFPDEDFTIGIFK